MADPDPAAIAKAVALLKRAQRPMIYAGGRVVNGRPTASAPLTKARLQIKEIGGVQFLDDSYNANPDSMKAALRTLVELDAEAAMLRETIRTSKGQKQQRAIKRLKVVNAFITSENRPEWMILEAIPVIPPELRGPALEATLERGQNNRCPGGGEHKSDDGTGPYKPTPDFPCDPSQVLPGP